MRPGNDDGVLKFWRNWRGHDDVMLTRSIRGSGDPAWVNASLNACFRLGPAPRIALWPAASPPHKQAGHNGWLGQSWFAASDTQNRSCCWQREYTNWRGHDDVMLQSCWREQLPPPLQVGDPLFV